MSKNVFWTRLSIHKSSSSFNIISKTKYMYSVLLYRFLSEFVIEIHLFLALFSALKINLLKNSYLMILLYIIHILNYD